MIHALFLFASLAAAAPEPAASESAIRLSSAQAHAIGLKIWQNEAGGKVKFLTHWNVGEDFGSFGIGHFIWYPAGKQGPFTESFPGVVDALAAAGETIPAWMQNHPPCPWADRASFFADFDGPRLTELRALLARTMDVQALYAAHRLENALPKVLEAAEPSERETLKKRFDAVAAAPNGVYALMDYVNFKGEGTSPTERYAGQGWGLLQTLELTADAAPGQPSVEAFAKAADAALTRRVANAPPERKEREQGWLPGWRKRLQTYLPSDEAPAAAQSWSAYRDGREVLRFKEGPGPLVGTAMPAPGAAPAQHPFLTGAALDAASEGALRGILDASSSFSDFTERLKKAGYRVGPSQ